MGALTLGNMQAQVAAFCGGLLTTDPIYTVSSSLVGFINDAANRVILMASYDPGSGKPRRNFNLFPELQGHIWFDVTVAEQGYLALPDNCLVPDSLHYTKVTTDYDPSRDTEYLISEQPDVEAFALLSKAATSTGWPSQWCRQASVLLLNSTPTTAYLTQVVVRGIRAEDDLSAVGDVFTMHPRWHSAVVTESCALVSEGLRRWSEAERWHEATRRKIDEAISLTGAANSKNRAAQQSPVRG